MAGDAGLNGVVGRNNGCGDAAGGAEAGGCPGCAAGRTMEANRNNGRGCCWLAIDGLV